MNLVVNKVDIEQGRLEVAYGGVRLDCKVLDNGKFPHIVKPPHVFISGSHWRDFLNTVRAGWLGAKEMEKNERVFVEK